MFSVWQLEILTNLATETNIATILREFQVNKAYSSRDLNNQC